MDIPEIALGKQHDGSVILRVTRADGSAVWQKQHGTNAAFFPLHDLTHYAVESELAIDDAFYGLIAAGWSLVETEGKGARGPLPVTAVFVEAVVGMLDVERASATRWTVAEFNDALATHMSRSGRGAPRRLTDDELTRIRRRRAQLFQQWEALAPGSTLTLTWDVPRTDGDGAAPRKDR